jgi:hypothetical protein
MDNQFAYNPYESLQLNLWDVYRGLSRIQFDRPLDDYVEEEYIETLSGTGAWGIKDNDSLLRFLILYTDKKSPYNRLSDFEHRKKVIIKEFVVGVLEYGSNHKLVKEIENEGDIFDRFLGLYFIAVNDLNYEQWFSYRRYLYNLNETLRSRKSLADPALINATSRALKEIPIITKQIMELEVILFDDPLMRQKILEGNGDKIAGFAEKFAQDGFAAQRQKEKRQAREDEVIKTSIFSLGNNSYK